MGQIANQMALGLFSKFKEKRKEKRKEKKQQKGKTVPKR